MSWRRTLTYWMLFTLLGGYYWVFERRAAPPSEVQLAREKVLNVYTDEVSAITLRRGGKEIRCERRDKRWQIVKPPGAKVPGDLVAALVENLTEKQEAEEIVGNPKPEDLQAYGLTEEASLVDVELASGKKFSVKLGGRNPPQTAIYAQTSVAPRVLLVGLNVQYYADLLYEAGSKEAVAGTKN